MFYVITQASNLNRVVEFKVRKFSPCLLSDHCPLQYKLKLNMDKRVAKETRIDMKELPPRCKWDQASKTSFVEALKAVEIHQVFEKPDSEDLPPEKGSP